ncbi:MAG: F0F1 ATP synthase subunit A [Planctomycetota bacterium]
MRTSFEPQIVWTLGPVELTRPALTALGLTVAFAVFAWWLRRRLSVDRPGLVQAVAEGFCELVERTVRQIAPGDPWRVVPLVGTLGLYIAVADTVEVVPGLSAPTGDLSVAAALAVVVLLATPLFGIRALGLRGYLGQYLRPTPFMLPFNVISEVSRTIALAVRLFGNVMSLGLVVSVLLLVAALLVPVPIMALGLLTGLIQAYIFAVLATVYVGAAMRRPPERAAAAAANQGDSHDG